MPKSLPYSGYVRISRVGDPPEEEPQDGLAHRVGRVEVVSDEAAIGACDAVGHGDAVEEIARESRHLPDEEAAGLTGLDLADDAAQLAFVDGVLPLTSVSGTTSSTSTLWKAASRAMVSRCTSSEMKLAPERIGSWPGLTSRASHRNRRRASRTRSWRTNGSPVACQA